jgi:hypothetical protein
MGEAQLGAHRIMEEKMFEAKRIKRMAGRINNQAPTPSPMQDFKCVPYKSKGKLEKDVRKGLVV